MRIVILSGVPGSGKSTFVSNLKGSVKVCSADNFFMKEGEYRFDPSKLGYAHGECLRDFVAALIPSYEECDVLVVDNTNTSALELAPYVALASAYGVECEIVTLLVDPEVAFNRNVHGVPLAGIQRMAKALEERKLPPFWDVKLTTHDHL